MVYGSGTPTIANTDGDGAGKCGDIRSCGRTIPVHLRLKVRGSGRLWTLMMSGMGACTLQTLCGGYSNKQLQMNFAVATFIICS